MNVSSWLADGHLLAMSSLGFSSAHSGRKKDFPPSSIKATSPIELGPHSVTSFHLNYHLKLLSVNISLHWELRLQHKNWRWGDSTALLQIHNARYQWGEICYNFNLIITLSPVFVFSSSLGMHFRSPLKSNSGYVIYRLVLLGPNCQAFALL